MKYFVGWQYGDVYMILTEEFDEDNGIGNYYNSVVCDLCSTQAKFICDILNKEYIRNRKGVKQ